MFDPLETNEGGLVADFYLARKKERKKGKWRLVENANFRGAKNSLNQPVSSNGGEPRSINRNGRGN